MTQQSKGKQGAWLADSLAKQVTKQLGGLGGHCNPPPNGTQVKSTGGFWGRAPNSFGVLRFLRKHFQHSIFHFAAQTNRPIIQWETSSQQSKTVWLNSRRNSLCDTNLHANTHKHMRNMRDELNPTCFIFLGKTCLWCPFVFFFFS